LPRPREALGLELASSDPPKPRYESAEREIKRRNAWIHEFDFELPVRDRLRLSDQLIQPLFGNRAVALAIDINSVSGAWRLSSAGSRAECNHVVSHPAPQRRDPINPMEGCGKDYLWRFAAHAIASAFSARGKAVKHHLVRHGHLPRLTPELAYGCVHGISPSRSALRFVGSAGGSSDRSQSRNDQKIIAQRGRKDRRFPEILAHRAYLRPATEQLPNPPSALLRTSAGGSFYDPPVFLRGNAS